MHLSLFNFCCQCLSINCWTRCASGLEFSCLIRCCPWTSVTPVTVLLFLFITVGSQLLCRMKRLAAAVSEDAFDSALHDLQTSEEWLQSTSLHSWFQGTWLAEKKVIVIWHYSQCFVNILISLHDPLMACYHFSLILITVTFTCNLYCCCADSQYTVSNSLSAGSCTACCSAGCVSTRINSYMLLCRQQMA